MDLEWKMGAFEFEWITSSKSDPKAVQFSSTKETMETDDPGADDIASFDMETITDKERTPLLNQDFASDAFPNPPFADIGPQKEAPVELLSEYIQENSNGAEPLILLPDTQEEGILHPVPASWTAFLNRTGQRVSPAGIAGTNQDNKQAETIHAVPDLAAGPFDEHHHQPLLAVVSDSEYEDDVSPQSQRRVYGGVTKEEDIDKEMPLEDDMIALTASEDVDALRAKLAELEYLIPRLQEEHTSVMDQLRIVQSSEQGNDYAAAVESTAAIDGGPGNNMVPRPASLSDDQLADEFELFGDVVDWDKPPVDRDYSSRDVNSPMDEEGRDEVGRSAGIEAVRDDRDVSELLTPKYHEYANPVQDNEEDEFFDALENVDGACVSGRTQLAATTIHSAWRRHMARSWYFPQQESALRLEALIRMMQMKKRYDGDRRAACVVQTAIRRYLERVSAVSMLQAVTRIQSIIRMWKMKAKNEQKRQSACAIQSVMRMRRARTTMIAMQQAVRVIQHFVRRYHALAEHGFRVTSNQVDSESASPRICAVFSDPLPGGCWAISWIGLAG